MVSADCILCGRKFSLSGIFISDKLLCPHCATHHESDCIKAIHDIMMKMFIISKMKLVRKERMLISDIFLQIRILHFVN